MPQKSAQCGNAERSESTDDTGGAVIELYSNPATRHRMAHPLREIIASVILFDEGPTRLRQRRRKPQPVSGRQLSAEPRCRRVSPLPAASVRSGYQVRQSPVGQIRLEPESTL